MLITNGCLEYKMMFFIRICFSDPPDVFVTLVENNYIRGTLSLSCDASGVPDTYTYRPWHQIWPEYGVVREWSGSGHWLNISKLTYEHSGVYICFCSNNITDRVTKETFMEGQATVIVPCK